MTSKSQTAAFANLAKDTIRVDATSADIAKAAKAAKVKTATQKGFAYHTKAISYHAQAAVAAHTFYLSIASGVVIGVAAFYLVNKFWLNKDSSA